MNYRTKRLTNSEFIANAQAVHEFRFDYSETIYKGANSRVNVICPIHGVFSVRASTHLSKNANGAGCKFCSGHSRTLEQFVAKARAVHGDKYDYSETEYFPQPQKISIKCRVHGIFKQVGNRHITGNGCPQCGKSNRPPGIGWGRSRWSKAAAGKKPKVYLIRLFNDSESFFKIGITFNPISERFVGKIPYLYEEIRTFSSDDPIVIYDLEKKVKKTLRHLRYRPKISFAGETECFSISSADEILAIFPL